MSRSKFEVRVIPTKEEYARLVDVLWAANFNPYKYVDDSNSAQSLVRPS